MKHIVLLSLAGAIAVALPATRSAALTGNELYQSCSAGKAGGNQRCDDYIHGFIDGMIMGYTANGTSRGYCPPVTGVPVAKGRAIIETWLREHPERLKGEAGILSGLALAEAFPCKPGHEGDSDD